MYRIRFEERQSPGKGPYGHKYWFWLQDAVDAPEYVVRWEPFIELAASYGLELVYQEDFHTIYEKEQEPFEFRQLLSAMKVVDSKGESALDQDQWDAASEYSLSPWYFLVVLISIYSLDIYMAFSVPILLFTKPLHALFTRPSKFVLVQSWMMGVMSLLVYDAIHRAVRSHFPEATPDFLYVCHPFKFSPTY